MNNVADVLMQVTLTGKITYITENCEAHYGYKQNEVIGKNFTKFAPKSEWKKYFFKIKQMLSGKKIHTFETIVLHKNGNQIPVDFSGQMIKSNGKSYFHAVMRNITERKKIENEKEKIDKRYKLILENSNCPVTYLDLEGNIILINKLGAKNLKGNPEDLIGKSIYDKLPEFADEQKKRINAILKTGKGIIREDLIDLTDSKKWFLSDSQPVKNKNDKIIGIQIFSIDITDRKKAEIKYEKSEKKYQQLVNNIDEGLFSIDEVGKFSYANKIVVKRSGFAKKEFYKLNYLDIVSPKYHEIAKEKFRRIMKGEKVTPFELEYSTQKGEKLYIEINGRPIYKREKIVGVQCLSINITERKKAEKILKKSEEKFRVLADQSPNMIFINKKGKIAYINQKSQEIMGYTHDEFLADDFNFFTLVAPESHDVVETAFRKHMNGKDVPAYEYILLTKEGVKLNSLITTKLIEYEGESAILGIITDITQMKKIEREIIATKDYLQKVIDNTSEIIFTIDSDFKIRTWNKTAEQITGYKKGQVVGKSIKQVELFDYPSEIVEYIKNIQNNKTATINEISIKTLYEIKRTFSILPSYIKDESNNIIEILFVCRDITQEKEIFGKIQSGNSYLIQESDNNTVIDIFNSLIESKKHGLYIGRIPNNELQTSFKNIIPNIIKLTEEKDDRFLTSTNIEEVYQKIKEFIKNKENTVILIDRVDYLIINNSFESVMKILYKINDLIQKQNSILLLRVNPSIINQNQIAVLNEDFNKLPSQKISDIQISHDLYEILTYIQNESKNNITVTYGNIGKTFSISKVTAKRRLESLMDSGLIYSRKRGKSKILNITEKGKNLLNHRVHI